MAVLSHFPNGTVPSYDMVQKRLEFPDLLNGYNTVNASASQLILSEDVAPNANRTVFLGQNLTFSNPGGQLAITGGTITAVSIREGGTSNVVEITDLNVDAAEFGDRISNGLPSTYDLFFTGDDTINGNDGDDNLVGQTGEDRIFGNLGDDTLDGGDGNDLLVGGGGHDTAYGGSGADTLRGNSGKDDLRGQAGSDEIIGGGGNDTARGNNGDDRILGGGGNDVLLGGGGDDVVKGGKGNDDIRGAKGADRLVGQGGDDTIRGGGASDDIKGNAGNDVLFGQGGNDTLNGGGGDDTLTGDAGRDEFRFTSFRSGERDVITDFEDRRDKIDFGNKDPNYTLTDLGADTLLTINGSGHEILFEGIDPSQITGADFL